jgi:hypothetical protein
MLTTKELMVLQQLNPAYREEKLNAALKKAQAFSLKRIAPMTQPNTGASRSQRATRGTPPLYTLEDDSKRSFQLGLILIGGGRVNEGIEIMNSAIAHFPIGNIGQDGAHAAEPSALILSEF